MTLDEFNSFLQVMIGAVLLLAVFNLFRARKKGRPAQRMAFACVMLAVAIGAFRQEGRFGPQTIVCTVIFLLALFADALLRAKGEEK